MTVRAPHVTPRDVPPEIAVRRLGLTIGEFEPLRDQLYARGFPRPDPTTGKMDLAAIEDWMNLRSGLTRVEQARNASVLLRDRLEADRAAWQAGKKK